jgi:hypothetical protein
VTQHSARPTGENRRHPPPEPRKAAIADRIDAVMNAMQPLLVEPLGNRASPEPERHQLSACNHAVLPLRKHGDRLVVLGLLARPDALFCSYAMHNVPPAGHRPILAASV